MAIWSFAFPSLNFHQSRQWLLCRKKWKDKDIRLFSNFFPEILLKIKFKT